MQGGLPQLEELFHCQASLTNDRGYSLWRQVPTVIGDRHPPPWLLGMLHMDMTSPLAHHDKPRSLEHAHHLLRLQGREHSTHSGGGVARRTATRPAKKLSSGMGSPSSCSACKWSWIASSAICRASSRVRPSVITPGKAGTVTVYPPSSLGSNSTVKVYFSSTTIFLLCWILRATTVIIKREHRPCQPSFSTASGSGNEISAPGSESPGRRGGQRLPQGARVSEKP